MSLLSPMPSKVRVAFAALCGALALAGVASVVVVAPCAAAPAAPEPESETMIVQYVGNNKENVQGKPTMIVYVKQAGGSANTRPIALAVNNTSKKAEYSPDEKVAGPLKDVSKDDYLQIALIPAQNSSQHTILKSVKPYKVKPGELEPNVYIYQISSRRQEGGKDFIGVVLMKLGETITAVVPSIKSASGNMIPDQKMIASFDAFKKDQPVEVEFVSKGRLPVIATIDPYGPPEEATFVKMTEAVVKLSEADTEGQKAEAMELMVKGKPVTGVLTGKMLGKKWVAEPKLASMAKKLKPDEALVVRLVKDGDTTWVRYFKEPEKQKPEDKKPEDKKPEEKAAPADKKDEKKPAGADKK